MYTLKQLLSMDDDADISSNFEYEKGYSLRLKDIKPLWDAGIGIYGIKSHSFSHGPILLYFDEEGIHSSTLRIEERLFYRDLLSHLNQQSIGFIVESSIQNKILSRIYSSYNTCPLCCITAYRSIDVDDEVEKEKQRKINVENNKKLKAELESYTVDGKPMFNLIPVRGWYHEKGQTADDEYSFLILGRKDCDQKEFIDTMYSLGHKYNQDSILLRNRGEADAYYLYTNDAEYPAGTRLDLGRFVPNKLGGYVSHLLGKYKGASFSFLHPVYDYSRGMLRPIKDSNVPKVLVRLEPNIYVYASPTSNRPDKTLRHRYIVLVKNKGKTYRSVTDTLDQARKVRHKYKLLQKK